MNEFVIRSQILCLYAMEEKGMISKSRQRVLSLTQAEREHTGPQQLFVWETAGFNFSSLQTFNLARINFTFLVSLFR